MVIYMRHIILITFDRIGKVITVANCHYHV